MSDGEGAFHEISCVRPSPQAPFARLRKARPMPWLILSEDAPGAARLPADPALMAAHRDHERSIRHRVLAAGSLRSDDGLTPQRQPSAG